MKRKNKIAQIIINIVLVAACFLIIYPLLLVIGVSLTDEKTLLYSGYQVIPSNFSLEAYKYVFKNPTTIIDAYKVTFAFSVIGTALSVLLMAMLAYPLTKKELKGRNFVSFLLFFTMLFNGGLVPSYILITRYLHLGDTIWVYIFPSMISVWYTFMMRTFFNDLPKEIFESALVDGAGEFRIFFRMVIPLSKPVIAAVALFIFLGKWNDWFTSLLYINDPKLVSLQYLLQKIMNDIKLLSENSGNMSIQKDTSSIPTESVRMAMAIVVAGPALLVFPFFQKYFVKGLTIGSVKG